MYLLKVDLVGLFRGSRNFKFFGQSFNFLNLDFSLRGRGNDSGGEYAK